MKHPYVRTVQTNNAFSVKQLAAIYNFPLYTMSDSVVAIISFGGGIYGTINNNILTNGDVQKYWEYQGITKMSNVYVFFEGGAINDLSDNNSTVENTLDVSIIGSCCCCTILLFIFPNFIPYTSTFLRLFASVNINNKQIIPSIICLTWGAPETEMNIFDMKATNLLLKEKNINVTASAGDQGSTDGLDILTVDFPASCPNVTAVGGTTLICPNFVYDSDTIETVWNDTGGGISTIFTNPPYQTDASFRNIPDIALVADPNTGIEIFINGKIQKGYGGTSISSPLFAGFLAITNQKTFINPFLYNNKHLFNDITIGTNKVNNNGYTAGIGYDNCSGLGSINGNKLKLPI